MTQSKDDIITIDLGSGLSIDSNGEDIVTDVKFHPASTVSSISTDTINISDYTVSSSDQISFDWDNINIVPTLWTETLPAVDTVNAMCNEYPALAKAYENFKTVYKLVEQDYKGKQEDD
tara:strand:+ start:188 stop:544 length:357 start_codon:yes stop_codon:yes gene_type:complete